MMTLAATALDGNVEDIVFTSEESCLTIPAFYMNIHAQLEETLNFLTSHYIEWKIHSCLDVKMIKSQFFYFFSFECLLFHVIDDSSMIFGFRYAARPISSISIEDEIAYMERRLEEFCQNGSGWQMKKVKKLFWCKTAFNSIPRHIGHHKGFKLPPSLVHKKAVVNVIDAPHGECFK